MRLNFRIIKKDISNESWYSKDVFPEPYIEVISMRCLECGYREEAEADIVLECFDPRREDYPCLICPHCGKGDLVPEDVYDQIKGNFVYK